MPRARLLALVVATAFALPACDLDEFRDFFAGYEPIDLSTSPDPEVQAMGTALDQENRQEAAYQEYDEYIVSGKDSDFDAALQNQPNPQFYADRLVGPLAQYGSDSQEYARAKTALLRAEASRMRPGTDPAELERKILRRLVGAITRLMDAQFPSWRGTAPAPGTPGYDSFSELCGASKALETYGMDQANVQCMNFEGNE
ncbi:MAG: hypothetical protein ACRDH9_12960 [Actinomycetota bacterium]